MKIFPKSRQLAGMVLFTMALAACGGGKGGGDNPPADSLSDNGSTGGGAMNEVGPITRSNYRLVASFGMGAAGLGESLISTPKVDRLPGGAEGQSMLQAAATEVPDECDSGSGSQTLDFAQPGKIANGDRYSATHQQCRMDLFGLENSYFLVDGSLSFTYSDVMGDYFGGDEGSYVVSGRYSQWIFGYSSPPELFSTMLDGEVRYEFNKTGATMRTRVASDSLTQRIEDNGEKSTFEFSGMDVSITSDLSKGTERYTGRYDAVVTFEAHPSLAYKINYDLAGLADSDYPSSGTIELRDTNSPAIITVTILSETMAQVAFDENGDGVPEESNTYTMEELGG